MSDPVDLRKIARTALESFPSAPDGMDPAGNYAQVLLTKEITRLGKAGEAIDADRAQAWRAELEALLDVLRVEFVPEIPVGAPPRPGPEKPRPAPEIDLDWLVADAFSAPYDGTEERAEVLAARARGTLRNALDHREGLGWLKRWRLRREGERLIRKAKDELERF